MAESRPTDEQVKVTITRTDPRARSTFLVDRIKPMMVLDLLLAIQRAHDPSIGFRYSCRVAVCNVCGIRVDGQPVLACQTALSTERSEVSIEPLAGKPVLRDLVVEMDHLVDEWEKEDA